MILEFYQAFKDLDAEKMVSFYHNEVEFEDPAFGKLKGERAKDMWRMLIASQQGKDFIIEFSNVEENEMKASASWEAKYTFSKTGRKIHNKISAEFQFKDGLIIKHVDHFNLHLWAKQAFGLKGLLIGRSNFFKKQLHQQTNKLLNKYQSQKG